MNLVRIKASPETDRLGLSGKLGHVYGFTTPSVLKSLGQDLQVIGELNEDFVVSVYFEDTKKQLWFADQLLVSLNHDPNLEVTIGGRRLFYTADGHWEEITSGKDSTE